MEDRRMKFSYLILWPAWASAFPGIDVVIIIVVVTGFEAFRRYFNHIFNLQCANPFLLHSCVFFSSVSFPVQKLELDMVSLDTFCFVDSTCVIS